jgi:RNA polymerase sigma factor (sigma-70 family)
MLTPSQGRLVEDNLGLAQHLAWAAARRIGIEKQDFDDLLSVAYEGLAMAAAKFDPSRADVVDGVPDTARAFSGYARRRINGAILDWMRQRDPVPRKKRAIYRRVEEANGRARSPEEVSDLVGLPSEAIRSLVVYVTQTTRPVALSLVQDAPGIEPSTKDDVLGNRICEAMVAEYDELPPTQQVIVALRIFEGRSYRDIAGELGVTVLQIRVLFDQAVVRMHGAMVREATG